jgi:hypothetical protein
MGTARKQHVSKSGKSILAFRPQPVIGSAGAIPHEANDAQDKARARPLGRPAVCIDAPSGPCVDRIGAEDK